MFSYKLIKSAVCSTKGKLLDGWVRAHTKEGHLYYLNHKHIISQWDHPEYIRIMNEMVPINVIRYAAYRTALKLQHLRTQTKCYEISLQCVASAFDSAGLRSGENWKVVPVREIERIVLNIYQNTFKHKHVDFCLYTDLIMNMISNSYDENRTGMIQVLKCKALLTVMCGGRLQEKYRYLFSQVSDSDNFISRRNLAKLLLTLASIAELVSEHLSFGLNLVPAAVESCFKDICGDIGITEDIFLDWLLREPQTLVWWSTLYRLSSSEFACHDMKCSSCKEKPIVGLRYQCLKCLGYNLCQDCFLHDRTSKKHKLSHPIQEYCHESTGKDRRKSFLKIVNYKMRRNNTEVKPRYLTISLSSSGQTLKSLLQDSDDLEKAGMANADSAERVGNSSEEDMDYLDRVSSSNDSPCQGKRDLDQIDGAFCDSSSSSNSCSNTPLPSDQIFVPSSPRRAINSVIKNLEEGQRKFVNDENNLEAEEYKEELQTQINRLKTILRNMRSSFPANPVLKPVCKNALGVMESTPIVRDRVLNLSLSPIGGLSDTSGMEVLDNKENHYNESHSQTSSLLLSSISTDTYNEQTLTTISENEERSRNKVSEKYALMKNNLTVSRFSEVNLSDLDLESPKSQVPSFEFRTLRDSEMESDKSENNDKITAAEHTLQRHLTYLDKEFAKIAIENLPNVVPGTDEILDSILNILELIKTPNSIGAY